MLTQFATPEAAADDACGAGVRRRGRGGRAPGEVINQPTIAGYLAADMFIQALKKAGKNPTPETIQKAAAKLTYEIEGFVGPTKYPKGFKVGHAVRSAGEQRRHRVDGQRAVPVLHEHQHQDAEADQVLSHAP